MNNDNGNNNIVLTSGNIVVLRNGLVGAVGCFNGKPSWLIFKSYINTLSKYNDELRHKNTQYDVMRVYDGSTVDNVDNVFKGSFSTDGMEIIWERKE